MNTSMNEGNLWSGSELELLVILLEQEGFTWDNIVEHVAEDSEGGKGCDQCKRMLYGNSIMQQNERKIALDRSNLSPENRPTGFPNLTNEEAERNQDAYFDRMLALEKVEPSMRVPF